MTIKEMEDKVVDLICNVYGLMYLGTLKIDTINSFEGEVLGYKLRLNLANEDKPLFIAIEGTQDDFFKLLKKDLQSRSLDLVDYSKFNFRSNSNE